jgi:hypothetical protein
MKCTTAERLAIDIMNQTNPVGPMTAEMVAGHLARHYAKQCPCHYTFHDEGDDDGTTD